MRLVIEQAFWHYPAMTRSFEGLVAWITGAGSGIGRAIALELAKEGAAVAVSGRRVDRLAAVVAEIEAQGGRGLAVPCDVTDDAAVQRAVAEVVAALGGIDVAIANAGMSVGGRIEKLSDADWRRQFDINVFGAVSTARHALPELRKRNGRLCLVGSVAAFLAMPKSGAYSASKFAIRAVGMTLAAELHGSGVSVTTVHPGFVESEIGQVDNQGVFDASREDTRPKQLMWPADRAARAIIAAVRRRKREYVFTGHGKLGAWLGRHVPAVAQFAATRSAR